MARRYSSIVPSPRVQTGSFSLELTPLQSSFDVLTFTDFGGEVPAWVSALFPVSSGGAHICEDPIPHRVPCEARLRRFPPTNLRIYFTPQPDAGPLPVQGFVFSAQLSVPHRDSLPPCRWPNVAHPASRMATTSGLDFEALLRPELRTQDKVFSRVSGRSPLRVWCFSRCSSRGDFGSPRSSTHGVDL